MEQGEINLKHCLKTFQNKQPHVEAELVVKLKENAHEEKMKGTNEGNFEVTKDDFNDVIDKFSTKKKKSYDFIVNIHVLASFYNLRSII